MRGPHCGYLVFLQAVRHIDSRKYARDTVSQSSILPAMSWVCMSKMKASRHCFPGHAEGWLPRAMGNIRTSTSRNREPSPTSAEARSQCGASAAAASAEEARSKCSAFSAARVEGAQSTVQTSQLAWGVDWSEIEQRFSTMGPVIVHESVHFYQ